MKELFKRLEMLQKVEPTRFIVDVGNSRFNYEGDRSGIVCWGFDEVKEMGWLRRMLTKWIEYYDHSSSFKSLIVVDMVELARQRFFNPTKNKRGESFYTSLQQHVRKGFSDMSLAKYVRIKKTKNSLGNPIDIYVFEVRCPATDWMKKVPILPDLPEGVLDNFKLWAFDEQKYGVIINYGEVEHTFYDPIDLMCLITQVPTITVEPTEPVPQSKESTARPSFHTEDVDYDSFLVGETGTRADKGKNALPEDEPIDVVKLQSRVFELEQDSLSQILLIQELKTENEAKDRKIKDLETNMGHLSAIVLDMKQKLQEIFKGEFLDESSSSIADEHEPEMSRVEFDKPNRS
ncbi:hypothetical protein R6Q57_008503 [Mikania cordata]